MSSEQVSHLFEVVLTPAPADTTDIDAAVRDGRRRRRRRATVLLASAAGIAVVGIAATVSWPGILMRPAPPAAGAPFTGITGTTRTGSAVTAAGPLLGTWRAVELNGQDVRGVRDGQGQPLSVTFERDGAVFRWGANDIINYHSGNFRITEDGKFSADPGTSTLVGMSGNRQQYRSNPEAVERATEARVAAATATTPRTLLLLADGRVLAVYTGGLPANPPSATPGTVISNFVLYTHCGVRETRIGSDYYLAEPPLDDGSGNPPDGWGNPAQKGTMTVYRDGTAVFTAGTLQAKFVIRRGATSFLTICS